MRTNSPLASKRTWELLSRSEVESEYGLSKRWLEIAALKGNGPQMTRISRKMIRYRRADIESWLESRVVQSTSEEIRPAGAKT